MVSGKNITEPLLFFGLFLLLSLLNGLISCVSSVGSLGRYPNEKDVNGLVVKDCKISGTTNGIRIKTWANSPGLSAATNMTFENIIMNNVTNPIIIDQSYCPFSSCISNVSLL